MKTANQLRFKFIYKASRAVYNAGQMEMLSDIAERFNQYGVHPRCLACLKRDCCREIQAGTAGDMFYCADFAGYFAGGLDMDPGSVLYSGR